MNTFLLGAALAALPLSATAADPVPVIKLNSVPVIHASAGVSLQELTGRTAAPGARSTQASVALFRLAPGAASAWSHNKVGEESFFVLRGNGEVWTGSQVQAIGPGAFIVIPPATVRSIRASKGEALEYYAITTPAWSKDDDVLVAAPAGAPR